MKTALEPTAPTSDADQPGLRRSSLSLVETIGQSVANIAPTATPALGMGVVVGMAGVGTWLAFLIATITMIFDISVG